MGILYNQYDWYIISYINSYIHYVVIEIDTLQIHLLKNC